MNARQIGPLTGILFVVLVVIAFIVSGETPDTSTIQRNRSSPSTSTTTPSNSLRLRC